MNAFERRNKIIEMMEQVNTLLVNDLAELFNVSEVTIRNDLRLLEKKGNFIRFHGGATIRNTKNTDVEKENNKELKLEDRYQQFNEAKKRIALEATRMIKAGDIIILDSGSTTMMLAEQLVNINDITVITNNLPAAFVLSDNNNIVLAVCGGTLRHKTRSLHGVLAEQTLSGISANYLFIGADGIDPYRGITTFNEGYKISKFMADASKSVVVLLDSSKFGKSGFNTVLPIDQIDTIITDSNVKPQYVKAFEKKGIKVIVA